MNVIIEIVRGVLETPVLIEDDIVAGLTYRDIAKKYINKDLINKKIDDSEMNAFVERKLKGTGVELHWFCDIKVNTYKNK
jgi:hypothetical protein